MEVLDHLLDGELVALSDAGGDLCGGDEEFGYFHTAEQADVVDDGRAFGLGGGDAKSAALDSEGEDVMGLGEISG